MDITASRDGDRLDIAFSAYKMPLWGDIVCPPENAATIICALSSIDEVLDYCPEGEGVARQRVCQAMAEVAAHSEHIIMDLAVREAHPDIAGAIASAQHERMAQNA